LSTVNSLHRKRESLEQFCFLVTNEDLCKWGFHGYGFFGSDFVWGESGAQQFRESGGELDYAQDGCYVLYERCDDNAIRIGTDFWGYKKVYYFWSHSGWAVSNSIPLLIDWMEAAGEQVKPNYAQLSAIMSKRSAMNQLSSFATFVEGVRLLPAGFTLRIGNDCCKLESMEGRNASSDYEACLGKFIGVWRARFRTLMADGSIDINANLTGGVDSRTVFALFDSVSRDFDGKAGRPRFSCNTGSPSKDRDAEIAREICRVYEYDFNVKGRFRAKQLSPERSYQAWKYLNLGGYHPITFPSSVPSPRRVLVSGGGAANYKPFYHKKHSDMNDMIRRNAALVGHEYLRPQFRQDWLHSFDILSQDEDSDSQELYTHYQQFRNRFHAGRVPSHSLCLNPMGSSYINDMFNSADEDRLTSPQLFYDTMASLDRNLLDIPFDQEGKNPTKENIEQLIRVDVDKYVVNSGSVYSGSCPEETSHLEPNGVSTSTFDSVFDILFEDVGDARGSEFASRFFSESDWSRVLEITRKARENRSFVDFKHGQCVSAVLAAGMFFRQE